jgi:hypothetical protein
MPKVEWSSPDAQSIVLYGKRNDLTRDCYPIYVNAFGYLQVSDQYGMQIPAHDTQVIDESNPTYTTITFSYSGSTVGLKTIGIVGSVTTVNLTLV